MTHRLLLALLLMCVAGAARAACTLPYTLTNGVLADAAQVMANFNAVVACTGGGGGGGILGPSTTAIGDVAYWGNTSGTLLGDGGGTAAIAIGTPAISLSTFGNFSLTVAASEGSTYSTPLMAFLYANAPPGGGGYASALTAYAYLPATGIGNTALAMYGLCDIYGIGWCQGFEFDVRNKSGIAPDTGLPSTTDGGTKPSLTGAIIVCSGVSGGNNDCGLGVYIGNDTQAYTGAGGTVFNTGEYIQFFRQFGLVIDDQPSGYQTSILAKNSGTGVNIQMNTQAAMTAGNPVIISYDSAGVSHWRITQNGASYQGMLSQPVLGGSYPMALIEGQGAFFGFAGDSISGATINGTGLWMAQARGTQAAPTTVATSDNLGSLTWAGYDGAAYKGGAMINATIQGTVSSGKVPSELVFSTANTAGTMTNYMWLDDAGKLTVGGAGAITGLPTSAGSGGLYVCVDTSGNLYKKSACP